MENIPQYVLAKSLLLRLGDSMQKESLDVQRVGPPKTTSEGIEQMWICSDRSGSLFSFATFEATDKNAFGLKSGDVCLLCGPPEKNAPKRTRKDLSDAFERFERALTTLDAQRK
jgi:hypothetical protein